MKIRNPVFRLISVLALSAAVGACIPGSGFFQEQDSATGKSEGDVSTVTIKASAEPSVVNLGDTVTLTVEVHSEGGSAGEPVMESEPEGFQIISRSQSVSVQIINGEKKNSSRLQLVLLASEPGKFRLPAFRIGDSVSESAEVTVNPGTGRSSPGSEKTQILPPVPGRKAVTNETLL